MLVQAVHKEVLFPSGVGLHTKTSSAMKTQERRRLKPSASVSARLDKGYEAQMLKS